MPPVEEGTVNQPLAVEDGNVEPKAAKVKIDISALVLQPAKPEDHTCPAAKMTKSYPTYTHKQNETITYNYMHLHFAPTNNHIQLHTITHIPLLSIS